MTIDGYTFCGLSYTQFDPRLDGERFKIDDDRIGILAGAPWQDKIPGPDEEEVDVILSRVAIFRPITPPEVEEVSEEGGADE